MKKRKIKIELPKQRNYTVKLVVTKSGAGIAAEWLKDKEGIFTMKDVLSLNKK